MSLVLTLVGWHIEPLAESCILVYDHTSYFDAYLMILCKFCVSSYENTCFLVQPRAYDWLNAYFPYFIKRLHLLRAPSVHDAKNHTFESIVKYMHQVPNTVEAPRALCISPKGTIQPKAPWKSGYFYFARALQVPIVPVLVNWPNRCGLLGHRIWPTDIPVSAFESGLVDPTESLERDTLAFVQYQVKSAFSFGYPLRPESSDALDLDDSFVDPSECVFLDIVTFSNVFGLFVVHALVSKMTFGAWCLALLNLWIFLVSWVYHASKETKCSWLDKTLAKLGCIVNVSYGLSNLPTQSFADLSRIMYWTCLWASLCVVSFCMGSMSKQLSLPRFHYIIWHSLFHWSMSLVLLILLH